MSKASETRAVNRLRAASAELRALERKYEHYRKARGSKEELEILAAWNALQTAQWPFATGRYPWPNREENK